MPASQSDWDLPIERTVVASPSCESPSGKGRTAMETTMGRLMLFSVLAGRDYSVVEQEVKLCAPLKIALRNAGMWT
jgi:hypothetical protein